MLESIFLCTLQRIMFCLVTFRMRCNSEIRDDGDGLARIVSTDFFISCWTALLNLTSLPCFSLRNWEMAGSVKYRTFAACFCDMPFVLIMILASSRRTAGRMYQTSIS